MLKICEKIWLEVLSMVMRYDGVEVKGLGGISFEGFFVLCYELLFYFEDYGKL